MAHDSKLCLNIIGTTVARLPAALNCRNKNIQNEVCDELEQLVIGTGFLEGAPFTWVTVCLRFGIKYHDVPAYMRFNRKYQVLDLSIEMDNSDLVKLSPEELKQRMTVFALKSLIYAGKKYRLATSALEERYRQVDEQPSD